MIGYLGVKKVVKRQIVTSLEGIRCAKLIFPRLW